MKRTIIVLIVLGLLAALSASLLVNALRTDRAIGRRAKGEVEVIVVKKALPAMSFVSPKLIETKKVPASALPEGFLTEPIQVVGKVLAKQVVEGQVLTKKNFITEGTGAELAASIPYGMRAVSVPVSKHSVMGGLLEPGCIVDVIASFQLSYRDEKGQAITTTLLRNIQVLAVQEVSIVSKPEAEKKVEKKISRRDERLLTVTLMVDTRQAEALQLAMNNGVISLAMRNPLDKKPVGIDATVLSRGRLAKLGSLLGTSVEAPDKDVQEWLEKISDPNLVDMNDPNFAFALRPEGFGEGQMTHAETLFRISPQWEITVIRGKDVKEEVLEMSE